MEHSPNDAVSRSDFNKLDYMDITQITLLENGIGMRKVIRFNLSHKLEDPINVARDFFALIRHYSLFMHNCLRFFNTHTTMKLAILVDKITSHAEWCKY